MIGLVYAIVLPM